jgi:hypothetical protein
MQAMREQQLTSWQRIRTGGQLAFVLIVALGWFAVFGLLPLSFLLGHAIASRVLPILLGLALLVGLLVGDVVWHFLECAYVERVGCAGAVFLARRRRALWCFMAVPCVTPLVAVAIDLTHPDPIGIVISIVGVFVVLSGSLVALERSMKSLN